VAVSRGRAPGFLELRDAALQRLSRAPLPPLVVLAGEEPWVKERLVEAAAGAAGGAETFSPRAGEGDAAAAERLLEEWCTPTLFGGARLIVARGADKLLAGPRLPRFEAALDGPPAHALLVTLESLDGRSRLARRLKELEALVSLPPLRDAPPPWHAGGPFLETDLNLWIRDEARRLGLACDLPVAAELALRVGNEPAALARKLEQLALLAAEGGRALTVDDVRRHVRRSSARLLSLYEDALRAGDAGQALDLLDRMLAEGVCDHAGRMVDGDQAADTVLRGLCANLARLIEAHERLTPALREALSRKPWERGEAESVGLAAVLGSGGRRVFLERDLKAVAPEAASVAFGLSLGALRALRDGHGASLHALTLRLARAHAPARRAAR
jgi:DNA polymerase III delta subunit